MKVIKIEIKKTTKKMADYVNYNSSFEDYNISILQMKSDQSFQVTIEMIYQMIYPEPWEWFLIVAYIISFFIGVTGNMLVCFAVWKNTDLQTVTNIFMVNLSVADLCVILIALPSVLIVDITRTWFLGEIACKIYISLMTICITVSVLTLCAISVERWYAICYPLRFHSTVKRARIIILIIWIISVGVGTPEFVVSTTIPYRNDTILLTACYPALWDYHTIMTFQIGLMISLYFAPILLMTFTYTQISLVLWTGSFPRRSCSGLQREFQAINGGGSSAHASYNRTIETRKKAARMLVVVVLVFAVCLLPNHILNLVRYTGNLDHIPYKNIIALISHWAFIFNSCVNPIIYNFMSDTFRKSFKVAIRSCFRCYFVSNQSKTPITYDLTISRASARRTMSAR